MSWDLCDGGLEHEFEGNSRVCCHCKKLVIREPDGYRLALGCCNMCKHADHDFWPSDEATCGKYDRKIKKHYICNDYEEQ